MIKKRCLFLLIAVISGCDRSEVSEPADDPAALVQPVWQRLENGEPDVDEVYTHCCELVRQHLKHPATAVVSERGTVKRMRSAEPGWWVQGTLEAENSLGKRLKREWTISLEWNRKSDAFVPESISFDSETVYQSPELKEARDEAMRAMGNEVGDLPENIAREIRNVQAAVDDVLKTKISLAYSVQWPDDPARSELKVRLKDGGLWEVTGKLARYDAPRRELYGLVERGSLRVIELRFGSTYLVGADPNKPPRAQRTAAPKVAAPVAPPEPQPLSAADAIFDAERAAARAEREAETEANEAEAAREYELAKEYAEKKRFSIAVERLEKIVQKWPDTKAAKDAEKQLKKVRSKNPRSR